LKQHLTAEEREMLGNNIQAKSFWVWTETTERIFPDRRAGMPAHEPFRKVAPQIWVHRGFVKEASQPQQIQIWEE